MPVAVAMGGESTHPKPAIKAKSPNSSGPQPEVQACRGWWTVGRTFAAVFAGRTNGRGCRTSARAGSKVRDVRRERTALDFSRRRSSPRSARGDGIAKALGADRDERRAGVEQVARVRGALDAAHADDRNLHARGDGGDLRQRDGADRRPGQPAAAAAEPRLARAVGAPGASAIARSVLISETASAPPSCAAAAHAGDVGGVRRELDDQRLARARATRADDLLRAGAGRRRCPGPVLTFGQDTLSSIAAISARCVAGLHQRRELLGARAHHVGDQRHRRAAGARPRRQLASCGRSSAR